MCMTRGAQARNAMPAASATTPTRAWPTVRLDAALLVFWLADEADSAAVAAAARADEAMLPEATREGTVTVETGARDGLYVASEAEVIVLGRVVVVSDADTVEAAEAVADVRDIDLVEAPTSTVPVTLTRPSCRQSSTKELPPGRGVGQTDYPSASPVHLGHLGQEQGGLTCKS